MFRPLFRTPASDLASLPSHGTGRNIDLYRGPTARGPVRPGDRVVDARGAQVCRLHSLPPCIKRGRPCDRMAHAAEDLVHRQVSRHVRLAVARSKLSATIYRDPVQARPLPAIVALTPYIAGSATSTGGR
jgi:hypothetical protein